MNPPPQHPDDRDVPERSPVPADDGGSTDPVTVTIPIARPLGADAAPGFAPHTPRPVWRPWLGLVSFFVCSAFFVGTQLVGAVVLLYALGTEPMLDWLGVIVVTGEILSMALLPMCAVWLTRGSLTRDLQLARPRTTLVAAMLPLVVVWPITSQVLSQYLATIFPPNPDHLDIMGRLTQWDSGTRALIVTFQIALVPAVCEEILFRGLLLSSLRRLLGTASAVVIVAILFAAVHIVTLVFAAPLSALGMMIPLMFLGLGLTLLAAQTGTIVYSSILHFSNNLLALLMVNVLQVEAEHPWLESGAALACLAISAVAFLGWWLLLARRQALVPQTDAALAVPQETVGGS